MAGDKRIDTSQNDPLKNLVDGAKKAGWAIVQGVRVIPIRLRNWNHNGVSPLFWMDGCSVGGVALLHAGHKTGLMCTTVYLLMSHFLYSSWVHERKNVCVACICF
jgi:hypothetical protein